MSSVPIDLSNCDIEPIHIPGQIQSHGFLIALDESLIIRFHSDLSTFLPEIKQDLLGKHINTIEKSIGRNEPPDFINQLINFGKVNGFEQTNPFHTDIQGKPYYLIIAPSEGYFLLEFEPAVSDLNLNIQKLIGRSISEMLADKNLNNLLFNTAEQIKNITQYDRVMIYRFAEDGHGEVVAEAKNEDLEPWLGLHYPASDIPKQARELYKKNLTRLIANVHTTPSKIVAQTSDAVLDMTNSQLRAVSPIHIQYLKNMKVDSSFSISLLYHKELWGLIACHNYTPRFIDFKARESCGLIGQILSSALEFRQDEENQNLQKYYKESVDSLSKGMLKADSILDALTTKNITLLDVNDATGFVLILDNAMTTKGVVPDEDAVEDLLKWVKNNVYDNFFYTSELSAIYEAAAVYKNIASGLMVVTISKELGEYIFWFKPEHIQTVQWAGNPEKPAEISNDGLMTISPRKSFEVWSETVKGKSKPWTNEEIKSSLRFKGELIYAIHQKASEIRLLNEKLKQAYEELDTFSFTISHDLKSPLSTVKGYSQILKKDESMQAGSQKIVDRIIAGADKMNLMIAEILEYSRIGRSELNPVKTEIRPIIDELVKDFRVVYGDTDFELTIGDTPAINCDPVMINQVFSNLLSNAIKYSLESNPPQIEISGTETQNEILYTVKDNGKGIPIAQLPQVFELFKRLGNVGDVEGSGVGLAIVQRIIEKHKGRIWVDSEEGKGTTFYVSFLK